MTELKISDSVPIYELQKQFSEGFPYLKIEFLVNDPIGKREKKPDTLIGDSTKTLGQIRHIHHLGVLKIKGSEKVSSLEKKLKERFGLNVRIFRKTGNVWLRTNMTDNMTLSEQNILAKDIATRSQIKVD